MHADWEDQRGLKESKAEAGGVDDSRPIEQRSRPTERVSRSH